MRASSEKEIESGELFRQQRPLITRFLAENSLAPSLQNEGRRNRHVTRDKGAAFCTFDLPNSPTRFLVSVQNRSVPSLSYRIFAIANHSLNRCAMTLFGTYYKILSLCGLTKNDSSNLDKTYVYIYVFLSYNISILFLLFCT